MVLSAFDAVLTLWGLNLNVIREANPVMRALIAKDPKIFLTLKIFVPLLLGIYFWRKRNQDRKLVTCGLGMAVGVYAVVSLFHVYWLVLYNISYSP